MLFAVPHSPSPSQSSPRPTDRQLAMFGLLGHSDGPTATRQSPQLWPASHLLYGVISDGTSFTLKYVSGGHISSVTAG